MQDEIIDNPTGFFFFGLSYQYRWPLLSSTYNILKGLFDRSIAL